jgi:hypothetical protein
MKIGQPSAEALVAPFSMGGLVFYLGNQQSNARQSSIEAAWEQAG